MKVNSLKISGIGGIRELGLTFNPGFNAICGPNGIGKTTILNIIVNAFSSQTDKLKRNASYPEGNYVIQYTDVNGDVVDKTFKILEFEPLKKDVQTHVNDCTPYMMHFLENRNISYQNLTSIPRDPEANKFQIGLTLEQGISANNMKGWFDNRCLFVNTDDGLTEAQQSNVALAKRSFSILDPKVAFKRIDSRSLDIVLSSPNGDIYFEYLSAGYKSCVYLIMGLIKEIEFRFGDSDMKAKDFNGVILIDEVDLHLHPIWQAKLIEAFKTIFSKAQFIVTTHSPSVLQTLNKDEIIPLTQDDNSNVSVKELNLTEYGLQGWSIEEILRDVMEMPETTSKLYEQTKQSFDDAMNKDDAAGALKYAAILKQMLHPDSVIGKLVDIQIAGLKDVE